MKTKTRTINVRIDDSANKFLDTISRQMGLTKSEFIRNVLEYMFVAWFTNKLPKENLTEMRKEFIDKFKHEF